MKGDYMVLTLDCNRDVENLYEAYNSIYFEKLIVNIFKYFRDYFDIKNLDISKFKYKMIHKKNAEKDVDHCEHHAYSTVD